MKFAAHVIETTGPHVSVTGDTERIHHPRTSRRSLVATEDAETGTQVWRFPSAVRVAGILAFCQSLIFLVIWLLVCATAGAATKPKAEFAPELKASTYEPTNLRDPFAKPGVASQDAKAAPGAPIIFQLQGILYQPTNPSAIVNDRLLTLNKIVTLNTGNVEVQVKAVEITRNTVVLEVGGQKVELQLSKREPQTPAAQ
jgi:hypothetical protein